MSTFGLAQPVRRVEDPRLLKGAGRYADDIQPLGQLHGIVLRSPYASARIGGIVLERRVPFPASPRFTPAPT